MKCSVLLLTRSLVWDIRSFKRPAAERADVLALYPTTNAIFSPDNKHVVTGAGGSENGGHGSLLFLSRQNLDVVKQLDVGATPVVVQWHPKINQVRSGLPACYDSHQMVQIVVGLTSGALCVLYSPQTSLNGAKLLLNKGPAKRPTVEDMSEAVAAPAIIIPGVTRDGDFTSGLPNKRKRDKERQDPRKSRRPELPVHGPGRGGRVGASATQHVVQNLVRDTTRDEDVRVFSFSASAFCVALGVRGAFVDQRIAWSDPMLIYESNRLVLLTHSSGEGGAKDGRRVAVNAVHRTEGHAATSQFSWNRRGDAPSEVHALRSNSAA